MQCNCGGAMYERQEDLKPYLKCDVCGRVYAPNHPGRPESRGNSTNHRGGDHVPEDQ